MGKSLSAIKKANGNLTSKRKKIKNTLGYLTGLGGIKIDKETGEYRKQVNRYRLDNAVNIKGEDSLDDLSNRIRRLEQYIGDHERENGKERRTEAGRDRMASARNKLNTLKERLEKLEKAVAFKQTYDKGISVNTEDNGVSHLNDDELHGDDIGGKSSSVYRLRNGKFFKYDKAVPTELLDKNVLEEVDKKLSGLVGNLENAGISNSGCTMGCREIATTILA